MRTAYLYLLICISTLFTGGSWAQEVLSGYKFIENKGQWHENAEYRVDLQAGFLYLENNRLTFDMLDAETFDKYVRAHHDKSFKRDFTELDWHAYNVEFIGANPNPSFQKQLETPEYFNYFVGSDRSKWASEVKGFHRIKYENLYDQIDLQFYSKIFNLKYDFIVRPGGDPSVISMEYNGVDNISIKNDRLHIETSVNHIIEDKPYAYQVVSGKKVEVECHYVLQNNELTFSFPNGYDSGLDLVIDPTLMFSTYSGSYSNNFGYSATFDSKGFLYSGSSAFGTLYPTTAGAYSTAFNGGIADIAISKFDTTGTFLIYSTFIGGSSDELPHSLIVNKFDELFVLGTTSSSDYPYTVGCYDSSFAGGTPNNLLNGLGVNYVNGSDITVSHLSSDGATLMGSTYLGGSQNDGLNSTSDVANLNLLRYNYADEIRGEIDIDENNNVYVVSCTRSPDFPIVGNTVQQSYGGGEIDGCLIKLDNALENIIWSTFIGGSEHDAAYSLAFDDSLDVYITGGTNSDSLFTSSTALQDTFSGGRADGYIAHISKDGQSIINATYFGSPTYDQNYFVELDHFNNVYVLGQSEIQDSTFIHNVLWSVPGSGQFVSKMTPQLDSLIYSTVFGSGSGINISPTAFLVDLCSKMYLAGWGGNVNNLSSLDNNAGNTNGMPITADAFQSTTDGSDFYVMVLEDDGSNIVYGSYFGGPSAAEHVDGGTSRFDRKGKVYQAMCAGCGGFSDMPIEPANAVSDSNFNSCNLGVFKMDFNLPAVVADFEAPSPGCAPYTTTITNLSLSQNYTSYEWYFGDGNTSTQETPTHTYQSSGTYTITLIVQDTATCNFGDTIFKDVTVLGDTTYSLADITMCPGGLEQIGLDPIQDTGFTYVWTPSDSLSANDITNPFAFPDVTTTYTLLISNGICTDTINQTVIVHQQTLQTSPDTILCTDTSIIDLWANTGNSSSNYVWSSSNQFLDTLNDNVQDNDITVSPSQSTTYYIQAEIDGCIVEDSVSITILSGNVSITPDSIICLGEDTIALSIGSNSSATLSYDWSPASEIIGSDTTQTILVSPSQTQNYQCTVISSDGCIFNLSTLVTVDTTNQMTFTASASHDTVYSGTNVSFNASPSGYLYEWTPENLFDINNQPDANTIIYESTVVYVTISGGACTQTLEVPVHVRDMVCGPPNVFIPNAFTPNGDGNNDILLVRGNNLTNILFRIFDRWGELVFETTDQSIGWDAKFKGRDVDPAVYDYYLEVDCLGGETYFEKGNVTVIR